MEWEFIAPLIMMVVLILTVGGVLVLRPIATRFADLVELYARDRQTGLQGEVRHMRELVETLNARLHLMEERQDFTERLIGDGERTPKDQSLGGG